MLFDKSASLLNRVGRVFDPEQMCWEIHPEPFIHMVRADVSTMSLVHPISFDQEKHRWLLFGIEVNQIRSVSESSVRLTIEM